MSCATKDWFFKEYREILEKSGELVLTYILRCGTDGKSPAISLDEYLRNLPQESTANFNRKNMKEFTEYPVESEILLKLCNKHLKKLFNSSELEQMSNDTSCSNFDITLLCKIIRCACENVSDDDAKWLTPSDEMEYFVQQIKQRRNNATHKKVPIINNDEEFNEEAEKLTDILMKTLEATKTRYSRNEDEIISKKGELMEAFEKKRNEIQQRAANNSLPYFKKETNSELQKSLNCAKYLDPLNFLSGHKDNKVNVQTVFSRIDMISEENSKSSTADPNRKIDYLNLLNIALVEGSVSPQILLIEGDAGSGKTTLVTFIVSEWLKDECDRRMKGLSHYDLLLRVVCREENISTLDQLLKQILPNSYIRYGSYLLLLLKMCKVIFLIDGLDEMNDFSKKLITNILSETKECANFTLVCTTRPETVLDFKHKTPKSCQTSKMKIFGISPEERTNVVVKHYEWLTRDISDDTEELKRVSEGILQLKQIMEEISWMELFRLPLNLLFLAAVFYYEPTSVKTTLTQPQLYHLIHVWCIQKLLHRLHPTLPETKCLQKKVDTVLKMVYQIALKGLLQNRIYLTENEEDSLSSCCINQCLPRDEVIPAFYSMRRKVAYGVSKEQYYIPHKGFQDFFAARHIMEKLDHYHYKEGDIKRVIQGSTTTPKLLRLEPLRNMLCHLLGLLKQKDSFVDMMLEEIVDLMRESGIEYSRDWLSVLADTVPQHATLQRIALHIKNRPDCEEIIEITDNTMHAALALLPLIPSCRVMVTLERTSDAADLRQVLAEHKVVRLWHNFVHPNTLANSGNLLQQLLPLSDLENFKGHLDAEHIALLPKGLKELSLVIAGNDHSSSLLPALSDARQSFLQLSKLRIHVPVQKVTADAITHPLPAVSHVYLILSGVGELEVEAAWRVAAALCPSKKEYIVIRFPGASLSMNGWLRIVEGLADAGVRVKRGLRMPSSTMTEDDALQLSKSTKTLLKAKESRRVPENMLWL